MKSTVKPTSSSLASHCCKFRCSIRSTILALILTLIVFFAVVCVVIVLASYLGQSEIANSLIRNLHKQVESNLMSVASQPISVAQLMAKEFIVQDADKHNGDYLYLYKYMYPHTFRFNISGLYYAGETGFITTLTKQDGINRVHASRPPDFLYRHHDILLNTTEGPGGTYLNLNYTHSTGRVFSPEWPWYIAARHAPAEGQWCPIFVSASRKIFALAYAVPIMRHNGTFFGMAVADYTLELFSDRLRQIQVGKTGQIFIADERWRLVASSVEPIDATRSLKLRSVFNATNTYTRAAALFVHKLNTSLVFGTAYDTSLAGTRYFVSVAGMKMDSTGAMQWNVVLLIPHSDYFQLFESTMIFSVVVLVAFFACALLMGCGCSHIVARRLRQLISEINGVVTYQEDAFKLASSRESFFQLRELETMQRSVSRMKIILQSFEKYIPTQLLRYLVKANRPASLGLERSSATVMFVDVANFTTIMEQTRVSRLIEQFTEYSEEVIRIIAANHGTLDKMMGDGLMAFFGCPPTPLANHESWACRAALQIQMRLRELRTEWEDRGCSLPFHVRIGLASGHVSVGNVGSTTRFQYTVLGDIVNLASRMEGLNKYFGTKILVTHSTWHRIDHQVHFIGRLLATVRVKGRTHRTRCYELVSSLEPFLSEVPPFARPATALPHREPGQPIRLAPLSLPDDASPITTGSPANSDLSRPGTGYTSISDYPPQVSPPRLGGQPPARSHRYSARSRSPLSQEFAVDDLEEIADVAQVLPIADGVGVGPMEPVLEARRHDSGLLDLNSDDDEEPPAFFKPHLPRDLPGIVYTVSRLCALFTRAVKLYETRRFRDSAALLRSFLDEPFPVLKDQLWDRAIQARKEDNTEPPPLLPPEMQAAAQAQGQPESSYVSVIDFRACALGLDESDDLGSGQSADAGDYARRLLAACEELACAKSIPHDWSPVIAMTEK